ncbi:MAG: HAD family hydrolase [Pseudomonadota bacterium]
MTAKPLRIAMWSGPRNMSTTMMRSFGARPDTTCVDEPFYAAYLQHTGLQHPMQTEIFATQSADPDAVIAELIATPPAAAPVFYQKHMTHHMLPQFDRSWMRHCRNVFLIRHPARVIASYARKMDDVTLEAIGFPQQLSLFQTAEQIEGRSPLVVDSDDILRAPGAVLGALCEALDVPWSEPMLSWAPGPKPEDGAWAAHWYDAVWKSTGFGPAPGALPDVDAELKDIYAEALEVYQALAAHRLTAG